MRPASVVLVYDSRKLWRYELFFSRAKAARAYDHAKFKDSPDGHRMLETENGGYIGIFDQASVRLVHLDWLATKADFHRQTLLNLTPQEITELCARYHLPPRVIEDVARAERDTIERRRYYLSKYNERTKALMRKYLPRFVLRHIFY
jgi:hypothetical protein